jgi:hypothetical protein
MRRAETKKVRRPAAVAQVPATVVKQFRWRQAVHHAGDKVLLTRHTAERLLAAGVILVADGAVENLTPQVRRYRCRRAGDAGVLQS